MKSLPLKLSARNSIWRQFTVGILLAAASLILLFEIALLIPALGNWHPWDYNLYITWGRALREGKVTYAYPLPTIFWIFAPLSLLPPQFAIVWAGAPFVFTLMLQGRKGIGFWLFYPLLAQTGYAQLDGWLIFPLFWFIQNRPRWAALGAVLLLTKPTLAPLAILYALFRWFRLRDRQNLIWFGGLLIVFLAPAFVIDPLWLLRFVLAAPNRATEPNMLPRGASLWAWNWHGGVTALLFPLVALATLGLAFYIARHADNFISTAEILNLISMPFLYASNMTLLIPLEYTLTEIIGLTLMSWAAVALDTLAGGWGGAYTLIPLLALGFHARRIYAQEHNSSRLCS